MRRRLLFVAVTLLAVLVVAVASLPWWLGVAAHSMGGRFGLTFSRYERIGYARFALHDVEFQRRQTRVTLARAEADTPFIWAWHRLMNQPNAVTGTTWAVEVARSESAAPVADVRPRGWVPLHATLRRVAERLDEWLPEAKVGAGRVRWPAGELSLASAEWMKRELVVGGLQFRGLKIDGRLALPAEADALRLRVRADEESNTLVLESRGGEVNGDVVWWGQRAPLRARFAATGWLPAEASLQAEALDLPGTRLKMGEFYAAARGRARLEWQSDHFTAEVVLKGEPLAGKEKIPPFDVNVQARGDGRTITVESLAAKLPGISAQLSGPVTIERNGLLREGNARFAVEADLAQQPWFAAKGRLNGEARLVSGTRESPNVEFQFEAREVAAQQLSLSAVNARGRFSWPQLHLTAGTIVGGEGERLDVRGTWDFQEKEIQGGTIDGQIRRRSLARWLPAQPEFDVVRIKAELSGPTASLQHGGTAQAEGVRVRGVNPFATVLEWRGRGAAIESFTGSATAGTTTVRAEGAVDRSALVVNRLELSQGEQRRLGLTEKATVRWRPTLQFESIHLAGPEGRLDGSLTWGDAGRVEVSARNLDPRWIEELVPPGRFKWRLSLLAVTGTWDRGPLTFSISGGAEVDMGNGHAAAVNLAARGGKDGLQVEALRATEGDATVLNASGAMPVVIHPRGERLLQIDSNGAISVDALAAPHAVFWDQLAEATGVELKDPQASARVRGTWLRPEGELLLAATRIAVDPERFKRPLPELTKLDVRVTGARDGVRLETFALQIEGQALRAHGRLPVPEGRWADVIKQPFDAARRGANLQVEIPDADLAAFARFLPAYVAPKGHLQLNLTYRETAFDGALQLRDAASRPLGPLGVLQEINADVRMAGRTFEFQNVAAKSGGQPVALTGKIEMPDKGRPRFDLALRGANLPFVRQAGLLVRGDLDLKLLTPENGSPRISGSVRLRDSLFLSDVRSFLPQGAVSAMRRPPYFAIDTPPLNEWGLAVDVAGDRFLRLRTPVFSGVASARFRLTGSLGEPRAIGEATVDEGMVLMPFASFEIRQGAVRLTEANPYEPTIFVRGTGRRFGYDLTMELDGPANSPNVILSSSPALDSEQVLLMVMTGAPPTDEINYSATQRVTRIGTFLGQSLLGSLGTDAANADRLSIASGEKISKQGKETYEIEYKLSDRLTVLGEYNEFDEHNAGLKWRIFPKRKNREEVRDEKK